ncbi:MAG TPA: isoprenylcysteine carboxylmethyltransferase family protein [Bacteroidetes bacterium]|nr:isoprenylcysteine carboxylmethyltransferase family protein [Bacteroidota bacterium]
MSLNDFRKRLFHYRSYTPIPFLLAMVIFAGPTDRSMLGGGVLAVLGESIRFWGVAYAGSLTRATGSVGAPEVIVSGPFAFVRNPLYVGNIVMYVGIGIMSNALFPWLVTVAAAWFAFQYVMIVTLEEEFLEKEFGAGYLEFKSNVPRFLPRVRPYRHPAQEHQRPRWKEAFRSETRTLQALGLVALVLVILWSRGREW